MEELVELLKNGSEKLNISLDEKALNRMILYKEILKEWNKKINLTAIEEDNEIIIKHFIDSLSIIPYIEDKKQEIIDVGTGAGFPGIPIKITYENLNVTLLDSLNKRVKFLSEVISQLGLSNIQALHGRAEDLGAMSKYREKYDIVVARAVASLPVLAEYCLPFLKVGGTFIAMKGSNIEEIDNSEKALYTLGGEIIKIDEITLPFSDNKRNIILIRKSRHTPTKYPRMAGKPSKEPLV